MTVLVESSVVRLVGACPVEDAEPLLLALQNAPQATVDLTEAGRLHLAVVQLLLAAAPAIGGVPGDPFLRDRILPLLRYVSAQSPIADVSDPI